MEFTTFENGVVICGDCLEVMPTITEKSVDMVLCDLPYGCTAQLWDKIIPVENIWKLYNNICKKNKPVLLFSIQPFTTHIISSNFKKFKYCYYWIKNQGTNFLHAKTQPIRKIEEICVFNNYKTYNIQKTIGHTPTNSSKGSSNGKCYYGKNIRNYEGGDTTRYPTNILIYDCVDNYHRLHPNQKPVELCEYLIKTYTNEGDLVLDNCSGSGTTAIACINTNRKFICIEKEKKYYETSVERIKNHLKDK